MAGVRQWVMIAVIFIAAVFAGIAPFLKNTAGGTTPSGDQVRWPSHYEGRPLTELPLSKREEAFVRNFPGHVARFTDGRREVIIRRVDAPTRRLHSAADCLRAIGYDMTPLPARTDATGMVMSCMRAKRGNEILEVCEIIRDGKGASWPDVSQWYWSALFSTQGGPWWSYSVAEARP